VASEDKTLRLKDEGVFGVRHLLLSGTETEYITGEQISIVVPARVSQSADIVTSIGVWNLV